MRNPLELDGGGGGVDFSPVGNWGELGTEKFHK
jgi:hypothetical protein